MHLIYALHDSDPARFPGARLIALSEAKELNKMGFGVFWTVNDFRGRRTKDRLIRINAWGVDIDRGSKEEMKSSIERSPLVPTLVVETKRGYHVYWAARDGSPEHWKAIVWDRLVPYFGADKNAKDICRILRMPGFYHMKDPKDPFMIKAVWEYKVRYTEVQMISNFPAAMIESPCHKRAVILQQGTCGDSFQKRVRNLNCEEALMRLSGHPSVNGEEFSLISNPSGTKNIRVNGKSTSAWIDCAGKIGSLSGGGPHIGCWLKWYGHSWINIDKIIKEVFPEC